MLHRLQPSSDDQIILLGDMVNRGPDSARVLDMAREIKATALLGNHELRLLEYRRSGNNTRLKETDAATLASLRPEHWDYLESLPVTHHLPEINTVCVHGGFLPGIPWQKQSPDIVTRIQVVDREGQPGKRTECPHGVLWADLWSGPPFVIYGHIPRPDIYKLKWSVGIDTACVMGGHLTAYVLPDRRFVQVQAKQTYFGRGPRPATT